MEYFGFVGPLIGLILFLMGYYKGRHTTTDQFRRYVIDQTVQKLINDGYLKTKTILHDGKWQQDILKYDEEA